MIINYGGVKSDVNNKYDMWHKEILNKFGIKLKGTMREFYTEIQGARRRLEGLSIDASDDVTIFVTEPGGADWWKIKGFKSLVTLSL